MFFKNIHVAAWRLKNQRMLSINFERLKNVRFCRLKNASCFSVQKCLLKCVHCDLRVICNSCVLCNLFDCSCCCFLISCVVLEYLRKCFLNILVFFSLFI